MSSMGSENVCLRQLTFFLMVQCMAAGHHCLPWATSAAQLLSGPSHMSSRESLCGQIVEYLRGKMAPARAVGGTLSSGRGLKPSVVICVIVGRTRKLPGINCGGCFRGYCCCLPKPQALQAQSTFQRIKLPLLCYEK